VTRAYWPLLGLLAAMWGASYLFIKVAVDELEPTVLMFFRLAIAAALLLGFVAHMGALREVARAWRAGLALILGGVTVGSGKMRRRPQHA
jgi:uncharacterized membrane protein